MENKNKGLLKGFSFLLNEGNVKKTLTSSKNQFISYLVAIPQIGLSYFSQFELKKITFKDKNGTQRNKIAIEIDLTKDYKFFKREKSDELDAEGKEIYTPKKFDLRGSQLKDKLTNMVDVEGSSLYFGIKDVEYISKSKIIETPEVNNETLEDLEFMENNDIPTDNQKI